MTGLSKCLVTIGRTIIKPFSSIKKKVKKAHQHRKNRKTREEAERWNEYTGSNAGNDRLVVIPEEEPANGVSPPEKNTWDTPPPVIPKPAPVEPISIVHNSGTVVNVEEATEKTQSDIMITTGPYPMLDNPGRDPDAINIDILSLNDHADYVPYVEDDPAEPSVPAPSRSRSAPTSVSRPVPVVLSGQSLTPTTTSTAGKVQELLASPSVSAPAPEAPASISSGLPTASTAPGPSASPASPRAASPPSSRSAHFVANGQYPRTRRAPFLLPVFGSFPPQIAHRVLDVIPEETEVPVVVPEVPEVIEEQPPANPTPRQPSQIPSFLSPGPCDDSDDYVEFGTAIERRLAPHRHFNLGQEVLPRGEARSCTAESFVGHDTALACEADTTINVCGDATTSTKVAAPTEPTVLDYDKSEAKVIRRRTAVPDFTVVKKAATPVCDDVVITSKPVVIFNSRKADASMRPRLITIPPRKSSLNAIVSSGARKVAVPTKSATHRDSDAKKVTLNFDSDTTLSAPLALTTFTKTGQVMVHLTLVKTGSDKPPTGQFIFPVSISDPRAGFEKALNQMPENYNFWYYFKGYQVLFTGVKDSWKLLSNAIAHGKIDDCRKGYVRVRGWDKLN